MNILTSIIGSVARYTVAPICGQLGYLFSYEQNVEDLQDKIDALKNVKQRIQHKVEEAQNNAREIEADVNDWLAKARKIITEDHGNFMRDEEQANANGICGANFLNLVLRRRLSSRAKEMAEAVAVLIQTGENILKEGVCYRLNLPISVGNKGYEEFESRNRTLTHVMEALRDPSVGMVGLWGMGGVGKTMLAREVARRAKDEENLFTKVVFTAISKEQNIKEIQQDIGEKLRMQFDGESKDARADQLRNRLVQDNKILIIFDDIWGKLDLEDVGISFGGINQKGCKILLTTRYRRVLANDMDVDSNFIFEVGVLWEHEAMCLFRKIVGDQAEEQELQGLATEIVKECGRLPIAITTVASALKGESYGGWKNALQELRKSNPINIDGMHEKVYSTIKLSYDYLKSVEAKHLLLLCSLFPEDERIEIRALCDYGFGLNLFEDVNTLEEARNKTDALVTKLRDHSLLLDADSSYLGYDRVKLHDVIRDVVIYVASKLDNHHRMHNIKNADELEKYFSNEMFKDSTAISLYGIKADQYPQTLKGPELNLLRLVPSKLSYGENFEELPHQFFEGLNKLRVLDCEFTSLKPLPATSSFCLLPNLQTLRLTRCNLGDISWIGELKCLKILDLSFNDSITELPSGIGKLNRLLSLNLQECGNLKVIEPNVISSLTRLEELNLKNSFTNWEVERVANAGDERRNANLSELKELPLLIDLNLEVPDINSLPKDIFSENLEKYYIRIGRMFYDVYKNASRTLKLNLQKCPNSVLNEHDFAALLGRSDALYLSGLKIAKSVAFEIDRMGFQRLKHLTVKESIEIRCIVIWKNGNMDCPPAAFPSLESLVLWRLRNLENIIHDKLTTKTSFGKLRKIEVYGCDKLKSLFSLFNIPRLLERIKVESCYMMKEIISHDGKEGDLVEEIEISQLKSLTLEGRLSNVVQFIATSKSDEIKREGRQSIDAPLFNGQVVFPKLEDLDIYSLKIQKIWNDDQLPSSMFGFQSLTKINVRRCDHLKGLIPSCMTASLVHLRELKVKHCKAMKEIIFIEESAQVMRIYVSFPRLESLELDDLPNLERFCRGDYVDCPSLSKLTIEGCQKLKVFITNTMPMTTTEKENKNSMGSVADKQHLSHHKDVKVDQLSTESSCSEIIFQPLPLGSVEEHADIMVFKTKRLVTLELWNFPNQHQLPKIFPNVEFLSICEWGIRLKDLASPLMSFQNLKFLTVKDCHGLTSLFSPSTAKSLSQRLTKLDIIGCKSLRQVIANDDDDDNINIIFSQLESLELNDLSNLTSFYSGNNNVVLQFPFIATSKSDEIKREGRQSIDAPLFNGQLVFPKLDILHIYSLNIQKIWSDDQLPLSRFGFQSLKHVFVKYCDHLKGLIPSCMTASLVHLWELNVYSCKAMKEIVFIEESAQVMRIYASFPKLHHLKFDGLPNLERFCGGDISLPKLDSLILDGLPNLERFCGGVCIDCPSLLELAMRGCQKLKVFMTNTEKEDENSTVANKHISHHQDVVKVDQLSTESSCSEITCQPHPLGSVEEHDEYLVIKTNRFSELKLWNFPNQHQLPKTFQTVKLLSIAEWGIRLKDLATPLMSFQNLKDLRVIDCHGLTSLFSPSTAKILSQRLTKLAIIGGKSLRQVIADDDADNINIIFIQLKCLVLYDLSNLTSFYSGNNNAVLQFPHLNQLFVNCCPEMKTFCNGNIHCPSLRYITLPCWEIRSDIWEFEFCIFGDSCWKGDINTTIQKLWEDPNIRDSPSETEESDE